MFKFKVDLPKASILRDTIREIKLSEFNKHKDKLFMKTVRLIKNSADWGYSDCKLSSDWDIVCDDLNRAHIKEEFIPFFYEYYEKTFTESGYNIFLVGNHTISINWRTDNSESEDDS